MATQSSTYFQNLFITGYKPTQQDYTDMFQSYYNKISDTITSGSTASFNVILGTVSSDLYVGGTLSLNQLTANTVVYVDSSKFLTSSSVTPTELGYLSGVTSSIQTQINTKLNKLITTNRQTTNYVLVLADADKIVEMNVAGANNLTVPPNSSATFSVGTQILLAQYGAGQTTIVAATGVTIRSSSGKLKLSTQYSGASLLKIATDEWYLFGDITT